MKPPGGPVFFLVDGEEKGDFGAVEKRALLGRKQGPFEGFGAVFGGPHGRVAGRGPAPAMAESAESSNSALGGEARGDRTSGPELVLADRTHFLRRVPVGPGLSRDDRFPHLKRDRLDAVSSGWPGGPMSPVVHCCHDPARHCGGRSLPDHQARPQAADGSGLTNRSSGPAWRRAADQ